MPKNDEKRDVKKLDIIFNQNLPTLFADNLRVSTRADKVVLLRFMTQLPEGLTEQARLVCPQNSVKAMLDVMCSLIDYYPVKEKPKKKKAPKKARKKATP